MRSIHCVLLLAAVCIPIQIAPAQTRQAAVRKPAASTPAKSAVAATPATTQPCSCPPRAQHVQPYTAKQETTRIQTLADGTTVTTVEEIYLARDAEGRTRRETIRTLNGEATHTFQVFDYVTQTSYNWSVGASYPQVVTVYHPRSNAMPPLAAPPAQRYYPYHSDSLPPQTIAGVYVTGTRYTRTIPAGYEGNDHDLVTTTESWYAPSLALQIRLTTDDPRNGKSTTETTDINLSDPDPTLFQPPAGYQLKDSNP